MATAVKFQNLTNDLLIARTINLNTDTFGLLFTNTVPVNTQHVYPTNFVNELANGNGYPTGGLALPGASATWAAGVVSLTIPSVNLTATGGSLGPWRYYALYDITSGTLMFYWDYGQSTTLTIGQSVPFSWVNNVALTDT